MGGSHSEVDGKRRPKSLGGCVDVEELREEQRSKVMEDCKSKRQNLEENKIFLQEPEKVLKCRSDMIRGEW